MSRPQLIAEFTGTAMLVAIVVGSGIAAERLSPDSGLQLLLNAVATALGLAVLIAVFQPLSGAHFNPVVSLVDAVARREGGTRAAVFSVTQITGAVAGAVLANLMFDHAAVEISTTERVTTGTLLAEVVATAGLVAVIFTLAHVDRTAWIAPAVGAYVGAAYFFTSSTSFANPAVTIGRIFSDSFAGITPGSALAFVGAQLVGGVLGLALLAALGAPWTTVRGSASIEE